MKIIEPGKKLGHIFFSCRNCKCKFEADDNDYTVTEVASIDDALYYRRLKCICPCCKYPCAGTVYGDRE